MMDRRAFLTTPLVFGLRDLFGQEGAEDLDAVLARMKATRRFGIVILIPDGARARRLLGEEIYGILASPLPAARLLLAESALLCLRRDEAAKRFGPILNDALRLCVSPEGALVATDPRPAANGALLVAACRDLAFGPRLERLQASAAELDRTLGDDVRRSFRDLGSDSIEVRERARLELRPRADALAPLLSWIRRTTTDPERAQACEQLLLDSVPRVPESGLPAKSLPYGVRIPRLVLGCGRYEEVPAGEEKLVPACGISHVSVGGRQFVAFLAP